MIISLYLLNNNNLVSSSEDKSIKLWNTNLFYNISIFKGYYYNNDYKKELQINVNQNEMKQVTSTKEDASNNLKG